jgi:hypothetical protein
MKETYGKIVDVSTVNIGETIMAAAALGATSVVVADPTTFEELGGQVSINGIVHDFTGINAAAGTIILAAPGLDAAVSVDDRVERYPPASNKYAIVDLGIPEGEHIRVTVPHSLTSVLDEGMREEADRELVLLEERGIGEFFLKDVSSLPAKVQSSTFEEGQSGWAFADQVAQIDNLNVVADIGVDTLSARQIFLNGQDLGAEDVNSKAKGVIAWDSRASGSTDTGNTVSTTELKLFEFSAGQMFANRLYRITASGMINGSVPNDRFAVRARYTLDGSTPGTGSTGVRTLDVEITASTLNAFDYSKIFAIASDTENFRVALTLQRLAGTGVAFMDVGSRGMEIAVEDLGSVEAAAAGGNLSQKSYAAGGPSPDPDPVRSYTKTWWATWTRSYDGDNSTRGPDTDDLYQGYVSSYHGNTRSLIGFDYTSIQAALSGATIVSIKFTYRVKHAWSYAGANVYVSSHSYTSKPSTWSSGSVNQDVYHSGGNKEGSTYTKTLPTSVGTAFKNGTIRGLGFGPAPNNSASSYYAYMYGGDSSSSRPRITVTYTK